ncbi:MAG TPA: aldolase/citrate lyase family protein [Bryobacteraceae bacterium]|jgi:2-dehydro-3-deoxyglucarate aldolase/4-hydroxy-2-oxoheptanedioate aldolase|nr:aldolase/citrate lyase family protein [Bryobacteraceae bacterium]
MQTNRVKQALKAGKWQFGVGLSQLRSPEIPRLLAAAGFDFGFIDTEHGGFDLETVQDLCRVASFCGLAPIVRVADMQYPLVARTLDCGAEGVIFPRVESPEVLAKAVAWTRFPPEGVRGYGLGGAQLGYGTPTFAEAIAHANANTLVVLQIETVRAVEAREELLSVPGIDAVLIGPADLSISLGIPGDMRSPRLVEAIEQIRESCLQHGVAPGAHFRSPDLVKFWKERGLLFLSCGNEISFLYERASEVARQLRS